MGKHATPFKFPGRISSSRFARNGCTPHAGAWRKLAQGTNLAAQRMRKQVASYTSLAIGGYVTGPTGAAGTTRHWHFPFRSGVNVSSVDFVLGILPSDNASSTDPRVRLRLRDISAGTNTYTDYFRHPEKQTGVTFHSWSSVLYVTGSLTIPAEETLYRLSVELEDYGRVFSICAYERAPGLADDTNNGVCNPAAFEDGGQVLDARVEDLLVAQTKIWKANGTHLVGWTQHTTSHPLVCNATTYTNEWDNSTSVSASSKGFTLLTQYHNTRGSTTVPAEFGIYANDTAGTGTLDIRAQSASGTLWEVTGIDMTGGANRTQVFDASFVANSAETKYDIQARVSDGSTTYEIYALALWEYEA